MFNSPDERAVVVSEFLLYEAGIVNDDAIKSVLGKILRLEFRTDGWKLIASSVPYSEGWTAENRGRRLRIVPINAAFLGVVAGPGTGTAELHFEPPGIRAGLALSVAALLLGAALGSGLLKGVSGKLRSPAAPPL